jgi:hypothetical protein
MIQTEGKAIVRRAADAGSLSDALPILRELSLDDFGLLLFDPHAYGLAHLLPAMPAADVQKKWMGRAGVNALNMSLPFMRTLESLSARFRQRSLHGASILDYGCGWGRLLRLALYYSDPERLIGADAWEGSLDHARESKVPAQLVKVDTAPDALHLGPVDVAYAFSVFTHLPQDVARSVLNGLRNSVKDEGLLVFTFCPIEQWDQLTDWADAETLEKLRAQHRETGAAYRQSPKLPKYGWQTMSHGFVDSLLQETGWKRVAFDRNISDPLQEIVAAQPA